MLVACSSYYLYYLFYYKHENIFLSAILKPIWMLFGTKLLFAPMKILKPGISAQKKAIYSSIFCIQLAWEKISCHHTSCLSPSHLSLPISYSLSSTSFGQTYREKPIGSICICIYIGTPTVEKF